MSGLNRTWRARDLHSSVAAKTGCIWTGQYGFTRPLLKSSEPRIYDRRYCQTCIKYRRGLESRGPVCYSQNGRVSQKGCSHSTFKFAYSLQFLGDRLQRLPGSRCLKRQAFVILDCHCDRSGSIVCLGHLPPKRSV